jgi:polysaccharide export outer membrane protein
LGKSTAELDQELTLRLNQRYYRNISLSVTVKESHNQLITIDGAVMEPGIYPIQPNQTLLQSVALAKGPNDDAYLSRIIVFRDLNGQRAAALYDLKQIRTGTMSDPPIYPGDVVVVASSHNRRVWKEVLKAAPFLGVFFVLLR